MILVLANGLVASLAMAGLAMASVGLWTLRVALAARGRKMAGAAVAAAEAVVFALAFTRLASDLDAPERVAAYALGVAAGTLLGLVVDERMSGGQSELRVVVPGLRPSLVRALGEQGWPATSLTAEGPDGPVTVLFAAAADRCIPALVDRIRLLVPEADWTVHRLGRARPRVRRHDPAGSIPFRAPAGYRPCIRRWAEPAGAGR